MTSPAANTGPPRAWRWWHPRRYLSARELTLLTFASLVAAGLWSFIRLAQYVNEGEVARLDESLVRGMRSPTDPADPIGPKWFEEMMRDLTAFGGNAALLLLSAASIGYLLFEKKKGTALMMAIAIGGGAALSLLLKDYYDRPRPELVPHGSFVLTKSFPSGHSMLSTVTYLTLGAVLAQVQSRWVLKIYMVSLAVLIAMLVGISRVYLGVHWPSDVLAGWAAGSAWALAVWGVTHFLQRRGSIEPEPPQRDERLRLQPALENERRA